MFRKLTSVFVLASALFAGSLSFAQKQASSVDPLSTARSQLAHSDLEAAERTVWSVLSSDPNNKDALLLLGNIRQRQQRYPEAEALFRRVLQLDPQSVEAQKNLGSALTSQDKPDEATNNLRQALKKAPNNLPLKIELARAYATADKFADAATILKEIPDGRLPTSAIPLKAQVLIHTGKRTEAQALIPRAIASPKTALELAEMFANNKCPDLALYTITQIEKTTKPTSQLYYVKGTALGLMGDFNNATRNFRQALALDPGSIQTLISLADIAAAKKNFAESVDWLEKALAVDPNSLPVLRRLIEQGMKAGQQETVSRSAHSLEHKSSDPEDQYLAAAAMLQQHEYGAAQRLFSGYILQHPDNSKAFLGLGLAYLNQQEYPEARKALDRALELDPNLAEAQYSLGVLLNKEGDTEKALALFEKVIKAQPHHAKALLDAGTLYLQAGELEKAKVSLQASEAVDANDPDTQYQLSLLYKRLGNADEARTHLERFRMLKEKSGQMNDGRMM